MDIEAWEVFDAEQVMENNTNSSKRPWNSHGLGPAAYPGKYLCEFATSVCIFWRHVKINKVKKEGSKKGWDYLREKTNSIGQRRSIKWNNVVWQYFPSQRIVSSFDFSDLYQFTSLISGTNLKNVLDIIYLQTNIILYAYLRPQQQELTLKWY